MPGGSGAALMCIALDMLSSGDQLYVRALVSTSNCMCLDPCLGDLVLHQCALRWICSAVETNCMCVRLFLHQIVCVLIHAWGIWCCINVHCAGYAQQWSTNPCLGNASYEAVLHQPPVMALARSTSSCSYIGCKLIALG